MAKKHFDKRGVELTESRHFRPAGGRFASGWPMARNGPER